MRGGEGVGPCPIFFGRPFLRFADYETTLTHLSVVHGAGDCGEVAKGDFDSRLSMGPIGRRAGAILGNREGADLLSRRVAVLEAPAGGGG